MIYIRQSGSKIELADTPNLKAFAAKQGWKEAKKKKPKSVEG